MSDAAHSSEQALLGGLIRDPECLPRVVHLLAPGDFYRRENAAIYALIISLLTESPDLDSLQIALPEAIAKERHHERYGGIGYALGLVDNVPSTTNIEHYAKQIAEASRQRKLLRTARDLAVAAEAGTESSAELAAKAMASIQAIAAQRDDLRCPSFREIAAMRLKEMGDVADGKVQAYTSTGWTSLDKVLGGGVLTQECIVIGGRPGMCKTAFATGLALNWALGGQRGGIFSLEMGAGQLHDRFIAPLAGLDIGKFHNAQLLGTEDWAALMQAQEMVGASNIRIRDTPGLNLAQICAQAHYWAANGGIDFIVVDYLQLMRSDPRMKKGEGVGDNMTGLRDLGRELDCNMVVLSQLNRGLESRANKRPTMADLRESGQIEQDATKILMLYRDGYHNKGESTVIVGGRECDELEVIIPKNRHGESGVTCLMGFDGPRTRIVCIEDDGENEGGTYFG